MALDGLLLHALCRQFQEILPCKINKIHQISNTELLFHLRTQREKKNLLISCHSQYNRINLTDRAYPTPEELAVAVELFVLCVKLVSIDKILEEK